MKDELFAELLESVREGGTILRDEKPASRMFDIVRPVIQQTLNSTAKLPYGKINFRGTGRKKR
jgi:hypothetical protein